MEIGIEEVREHLAKELKREEDAWQIARKALTSITKSRAKVRHKIEVFEAQVKRAADAALGKGEGAND